jgi:hypothetical protein
MTMLRMSGQMQGTSASAGSPIDFDLAAGSVRVPQDFISGLKFNRIDSGGDYGVVRAADRVPRSPCHVITNLSRLTGEAGSQLIKPSELCLGFLKMS